MRRWSLLSVLCICTAGRVARAADPFEIQVYDGAANAPGEAGLELHVNRVMSGVRESSPPELSPHHQTHFTLEPSLGLTSFLELGGYLQSTLRSDGHFDYSGVKLRTKLVIPSELSGSLRFGVNVELAIVPESYDRSRRGSEIRPILGYESDAWIAALNPIFGLPLAQPGLGGGPTFEPAAMVKRKLFGRVAAGLEYYSDFGPVKATAPLREQAHYLYEAIDLLDVAHFELNAGIGEGLTSGSNPFVLKMIVGYVFD